LHYVFGVLREWTHHAARLRLQRVSEESRHMRDRRPVAARGSDDYAVVVPPPEREGIGDGALGEGEGVGATGVVIGVTLTPVTLPLIPAF
jgi:hypothetical protein